MSYYVTHKADRDGIRVIVDYDDRKKWYLYDEIFEKLVQMEDGHTLSIGVFAEDDLQVLKAAVHEFGESRSGLPGRKPTPARKWLSKTFDDNLDFFKERILNAFDRAATLQTTLRQAILDCSDEIYERVEYYVETTAFPPPLSPHTWPTKTTDLPLIETRAMIDAIGLRYTRGVENGGSNGEPVAPIPPNPAPPPTPPHPPTPPGPTPPLPPVPPRPKKLRVTISLTASLRLLLQSISGPELYEGYGQRKRAQKKPGTSTTVQWPSGVKRMPQRSPGGRYPSDSRPKGD
jgi:hypothetical protein